MNDIDRRTRDNPESCMVTAPSAPKPARMDAYYSKLEAKKRSGGDRPCINCKHMRLASYGGPYCHKKAFTYVDPISGDERTDRIGCCTMQRFNNSVNFNGEHEYCGYEGSWFEPKGGEDGATK